ncbi:MAG: hypothetical protein F6K65_08610 [Moorea sp. SIO3C2]|nr:hypothetical protein [Moorena sp. SIO3C2]
MAINKSLISNKILHSPHLPISSSPHHPITPSLSRFPIPYYRFPTP